VDGPPLRLPSPGPSRIFVRLAGFFGAALVAAAVGCAQGSIEDEETGPRERPDIHTPPPLDTAGPEDAGEAPTDTITVDFDNSDAGDTSGETGGSGLDGGDTSPTDAADGETDGGPDAADTADGGREVGPCGGACGATEICENGVCVDVCDRKSAECGTVTESGRDFDCGSCGNNEYCGDHQCRDICSASGAECGDIFWGGATGNCGGCGGSRTCANNQCARAGYRAITGGYRHSCSTRDNGNAVCWGGDRNNQLGNGSDSASTTPVGVDSTASLAGVRSLNSTSCAVTHGGGAECWGLNHTGQLGDGSDSSRTSAVAVRNLTRVVDISAGNLHSCAVVSSGDVKCWGEQSLGRLGNGNVTGAHKTHPVDVQSITDAVAVSTGGDHTCALRSDGSVWCWGSGQYGVLGNGSFSNGSSTPVEVNKLEGAVDVSAGDAHTCAVARAGEVWCWGKGGAHQLGNGNMSNKAVPVQARGLSNAVEVAAGKVHTCALDNTGEVWCWGKNAFTNNSGTVTTGGQIGNGTTVDAAQPVNVVGARNTSNASLSDVMTIGVGHRHSCAIKTSGEAFCWGDNTDGQLGVGMGSEDFYKEPMEVQ